MLFLSLGGGRLVRGGGSGVSGHLHASQTKQIQTLAVSHRVHPHTPISSSRTTASSRVPIASHPSSSAHQNTGLGLTPADAHAHRQTPDATRFQPPKRNERSRYIPFSLFYARVEQSTWLDPSLKRVRLRRIDRRGAARRPPKHALDVAVKQRHRLSLVYIMFYSYILHGRYVDLE